MKLRASINYPLYIKDYWMIAYGHPQLGGSTSLQRNQSLNLPSRDPAGSLKLLLLLLGIIAFCCCCFLIDLLLEMIFTMVTPTLHRFSATLLSGDHAVVVGIGGIW